QGVEGVAADARGVLGRADDGNTAWADQAFEIVHLSSFVLPAGPNARTVESARPGTSDGDARLFGGSQRRRTSIRRLDNMPDTDEQQYDECWDSSPGFLTVV